MDSVQRRKKERSREAGHNNEAKIAPKKLKAARLMLGYKMLRNKAELQKLRGKLERRRKRKLPGLSKSKQGPTLKLEDPSARRAAIQWYCGTFPILPEQLSTEAARMISQEQQRLGHSMQASVWTRAEQATTEKMLSHLKTALPTTWGRG